MNQDQSGDANGLLTIGRVVEQLRDEFPDLSISKVRYLENRGLLEPHRSPGGYRKYSRRDVRRLETILRLQRDEFLPLEVIRERLDRGTALPAGRPALREGAFGHAHNLLRRPESRRPWDEVLEETGVERDFVDRLAEFRLIEGSPRSADGTAGETDMEIIQICKVLARFGVEPRNLRLLRSSAEREAALLEQVVSAQLRSSHPERREEGEQNLQELGALTARLIELILYRELRRLVQ